MKDILLITPPFTQLNTPYPATAYLKGFLQTKGITSFQMDLGIEVILRLFSSSGLAELFAEAAALDKMDSENAERIYALKDAYIATIDDVMYFLQGHQPTLARHICTDSFLPQASRFLELDELDWAFGHMGMQDKAKHLATLYLEDLSDFIVECVDPYFGFSRYAERLGRSANQFDELDARLQTDLSHIDQLTLDILEARLQDTQPRLVCFSVPFPGNLYSAFRCAQYIKTHYPGTATAMGGGFPNTELRSITDARVFSYFDYITLDDGERPIELLFSAITADPDADTSSEPTLKRTFHCVDGQVVYSDCDLPDYKQADVGTPDYTDLWLDRYVSVIQMANPMHSLWTDGRWNKLTMAHGCYWGKCTFCDTSLDYIRRYEPVKARLLVDRMEEMIEATGENGFHFVDEAAPPALMRSVALEILRRGLTVTWWTNIRFEKSFTRDLCLLLKASGCIAVSGGLEVASNRLLQLINKGVTVEQVACVTHHLTEAGIMVHAYLMYGYPTQTEQETIDSLEMVRQLFEEGVIHSGFWHRFALTAHSPIGAEPEAYGLVPDTKAIAFAHNDIEFEDSTGVDHEAFAFGLKKSLYNFMHGVGFDFPLQEWFDMPVPASQVRPNLIAGSIASEPIPQARAGTRLIWVGPMPLVSHEVQPSRKKKKGNKALSRRFGGRQSPRQQELKEMLRLTCHERTGCVEIVLERAQGEWFVGVLERLRPQQETRLSFAALQAEFEERFEKDFASFWHAQPVYDLREAGLLLLM